MDADTGQVRRTARYEGAGWLITGLLARPILAELVRSKNPKWGVPPM